MQQKKKSPRYVVCVKNKGFAASLERRKIYRVLPDVEAEKHRLLRVIDETGGNYLYPEEYFVGLELPVATARAVAAAG